MRNKLLLVLTLFLFSSGIYAQFSWTVADGSPTILLNPSTITTCDGIVSNVQVEYNDDCTAATITWNAPEKKAVIAPSTGNSVVNYNIDEALLAEILSAPLSDLPDPDVGKYFYKDTDVPFVPTRGDFIYGSRISPTVDPVGHVEISVTDPGEGTTQTPFSTYVIGGAYYDGYWYGSQNDAGSSFPLHKINHNTGEFTILSTHTNYFNALSYNYADNTMYGLRRSENIIYAIDLNTGSATFAKFLTGTPENGFISMEFGLNGILYGVELRVAGADFYSINIETGICTLIGATGMGCNYAQSIAFDYETEILYWCNYVGSGVSSLCTIDLKTGAATQISPTWIGEIGAAYFPYEHNPDVITYNVYRDDVKIASEIEETTFEDTTFEPTQPHKWSVAVVCLNGEEGEWIDMDKLACIDVPPPPPCNPATALEVKISENCVATLTWIAAAEMQDAKYNVYRNNVKIATVSETTYLDDDVEPNVEHTWMVKTVCEDGEATGIDAKEECKVGVKELDNKVFIFPNPSNGTITINAKDFVKIEIYNTVGQLVETKNINTVDVSSYNVGVYFFKVYDSNNNSVIKRVVVTK
jgi:hypothetical protein